jgi:hypothetical protein
MYLILKNTKTNKTRNETLNGNLVIQGNKIFDVVEDEGYDDPDFVLEFYHEIWHGYDGKWDDIQVVNNLNME